MLPIAQIFARGLNRLAPLHCPLCEAASPKYYICEPCTSTLTPNPHACPVCAIPLADENLSICATCLTSPPPYEFSTVPLIYDASLTPILKAFKDKRSLASGKVLSDILHMHLQVSKHRLPELIVPVPSHWQTYLVRGFNPAEEIAKHLAKALNIPYSNALIKTRKTQKQKSMSKRERQRNLRGVFALKPLDENISRIALVDDVVTTGATTHACATLLKSAGVNQVQVWALARTPSPK